MLRIWLTTILILFCFALSVFSGTTGKIAGKVVDRDSGSPLPGVNVMIVGTTMGAASGIDGTYSILNVPPGTYELKFSMVGYAEHRVQQVRVAIDLTTTTDAGLVTQALVGEDVVVVAKRAIVTKDISNSQMNIESATIETLPVQSAKEVLTLQAGIERGSEGIIVRGGGANQTAFLLDGLSLNDERSNIPYAAAGLSAVKEIQVQTGGFNAEYGNLRSGLVNVITREGNSVKYNGTATFRYSPAESKHFGRSLFDANSYFNRPYTDPAVCWTGTQSGAWDSYTIRQYPKFEGWNSVSYATIRDNNPKNDLTPEGAKRLYEWQHRRLGDITKPDYVADLGFGGPLPFISKPLGDLRFFLSHFRERNMFVFPLSRDSYSENQTQLKLTSDISPRMKLTLTGLYGEVRSVSPYDWKVTPTGYVLREVEEVANLLSATSGNSILYMPGYYSPSDIFRSVFGLQLTHMVTPKTYYEVSLQYNLNRYNTFKTATRDTSKQFEPLPGYWVDEAPYGYWGYGVTGVDGMSLGGWMNLGRDQSVNSTTSFRFDITSQVDSRNQIKLGVQAVYNDYDIKSSTVSPSMNTWTRSMLYHVFPFRVGAFLQDKLEFEGFIANLGLRLDYSDPNAQNFDVQEYDKNLGAGYGNSIEKNVETSATSGEWYWSPRLGISHPITENSKLYFNYGHFRSEPASSYRFRLQRESNGLVTYLGNSGLELEKTVAYELGYSQNILDMLLLNVAAYYKDVTNQPGWIFYQNINNSVQYYKAANNNYADIRGFEVTLTKRAGAWLTGFVNYTYHVLTSGYFGLTNYYQNPTKQRDYLRLNPYQSRPHPQPYLRANIDLHTPDHFGPRLAGIYPLGRWNLNLLADWKAGGYETYNPNSIPGVVDDVQWKDWYNLDLRLSKVIAYRGLDLQCYIDFTNVLNTKHLSMAGFADNYDYLDYLASLNFSWEKGDEKGDDRVGTYRPEGVAYDPLELNPNNDPEIHKRNEARKEKKSYIDMPNIDSLTFLNPRDITFGIKIYF